MRRQSHSPGVPIARLGGDLPAMAALVAAATLYYLLPVAGLSLVCLALLCYLVWRRSDLAVTLIPLAVPLYMLPKHLSLGRSLDFSLGETVLVLTAAVVLVQQARTAPRRPQGITMLRHFVPESPFMLPAAAFLAAAAVATLAAHFHGYAFRYFRWVVLEPIVYYWLITLRVSGVSGAARLALATATSGMFIAVLGVGQILFRPQDMAVAQFVAGQPHLVIAVYGNENNLALLLDRALPFAVALALLPGWMAAAATPAGESLRPLSQSACRAGQGLLLLGSLLMLYVLYRTESRGGELAVAASAAALLCYWQRRRPLLIGAGALLGVLAVVVERTRIWNSIAHGHGLTSDARISLWQSALRMLRDHPLFGVGPDNFLYYYSNDNSCAPGHVVRYYYEQKNSSGVPVNFEPCLSHPHNLFLDFWLSTGLLGFICALVLLVLFAVLTLRAVSAADAAWRGPLLGSLAAMVAFAVHGQVDNSYFLPDLAVYFWLSLGITALWQADSIGHVHATVGQVERAT